MKTAQFSTGVGLAVAPGSKPSPVSGDVMSSYADLYGQSMSLLTDLYQLTMAYAYWQQGLDRRQVVFHWFFRTPPFGGSYAVAAGLGPWLDWLSKFHFAADDLAYLATLRTADNRLMFEPTFLDYLADLHFTGDILAVPEGTVVFPHEPLIRVQGPVIECQLLETALLNMLNFATLAATKAARLRQAAGDDQLLEFGLRRAQGIDGGLTASRSAYIGGCDATSNVLAGKLWGIPVKGTHAHSWVMCFDTEEQAFAAYAEAMPGNCVFLVDTYDTLQGVRNAIEQGHKLRAAGFEMLGVRLDSGDMGALSKQARKMLDEAGFPNASVVASSDLDEHSITEMKRNGAQIDVWGVGTRLVTCYDQPALGGVYKLAGIQDEQGQWQLRVKLSDTPAKVSNPGVQQVRRFTQDRQLMADVIYSETHPVDQALQAVSLETGQTHSFSGESEPLLIPMVKAGQRVYQSPPLAEIRQRVCEQVSLLPEEVRRFEEPRRAGVYLEQSLYDVKQNLMTEAAANAQAIAGEIKR